jgi:hypothetical protein
LPLGFAGGFGALEQHDPEPALRACLAEHPHALRGAAVKREDRERAFVAFRQFDLLARPFRPIPVDDSRVLGATERTEERFCVGGAGSALNRRVGHRPAAAGFGEHLRVRIAAFARAQQNARGRFRQCLEAPTRVARKHDQLLGARARLVLPYEQPATVRRDSRRQTIRLHPPIWLARFFQRRFGDRPVRIFVACALEHELALRRAGCGCGGKRVASRAVGRRRHVQRQHLVGPRFARRAGGRRAHQHRARVGGAEDRLWRGALPGACIRAGAASRGQVNGERDDAQRRQEAEATTCSLASRAPARAGARHLHLTHGGVRSC